MFCNCESAIETVDKMTFSKCPDTFVNLQKSLYHQDLSVTVKLIKISSHSGILGNEIADQNAKITAHKIFKGEITAPQTANIHNTYWISADIAKKLWLRQRDNESTARYTHNLIPFVGTKVIFPKDWNIGISYFKMLVHDTMLKDASYRTGTSATPLCDCGKEKESVENLLL